MLRASPRLARPVLLAALSSTAACGLLLDFDITGGAGADAAPVDAAPADADETADADADAWVPPLTPPGCGDVVANLKILLCTGFEEQASASDAPFTRDALGGAAAALSSIEPGSELRSLELRAEPGEGLHALAAEGYVAQSQNFFNLGFALRVSSAGVYPPGVSRTLASLRPYGTIDDAQAGRADLILDEHGLRVRADVIGGAEVSIPLGPVDDAWHRITIKARFDDSRGRLAARIDDGAEETIDDIVTAPGAPSGAVSVALSVSGSAGAPAVVARFDNFGLAAN